MVSVKRVECIDHLIHCSVFSAAFGVLALDKAA